MSEKAAEPTKLVPATTPDVPERGESAPEHSSELVAGPGLLAPLGNPSNTGPRHAMLQRLQHQAGNRAAAQAIQSMQRAAAPSVVPTEVSALLGVQRQAGSAATVQLLDDGGAPGHRRPVPAATLAKMHQQVEEIANGRRERLSTPKGSETQMVVFLVRDYARDGNGSSDLVDKFVELLMIKTVDRGVLIADWASVWDDTLEHAPLAQLGELRKYLGKVGSPYAAATPPVSDKPSFIDEVADPVFFAATSLLSFGIVDKDLFIECNEHVMKGDDKGLSEYLDGKVSTAIVNFFTLGAAQAIYDEASDNPAATIADLAWVAFLAPMPTEFANAVMGTPVKPGDVPPDTWKRIELGFTGLMKLAALIGVAQGVKNLTKGKATITGDELHRGLATGKVPRQLKVAEAEAGKSGKGSGKIGQGKVAQPAVELPRNVTEARRFLLEQVGEEGSFRATYDRLVAEGKVEAADALEVARVKVQEQLGGTRTGRKGGASDLDVTARSNARAHQMMVEAVELLLNKNLEKLPPAEQTVALAKVRAMLDLSIGTDVGMAILFESPALARGGAAIVEAAGRAAAEVFELRTLKAMAEKGNTVAGERLAKLAAERNVDLATIEPLERMPPGKLGPKQKARLEQLKREVDSLALEARRSGKLSAEAASRLVKLQVELDAFEPEMYFSPDAIKAEVALRNPGASSVEAKPLTLAQAKGNVSANLTDAINTLTPAGKGTAADPYLKAGRSPAFAKKIWRALRSADLAGVKVDRALLKQAETIMDTKSTKGMTDAQASAFARQAIEAATKAEGDFAPLEAAEAAKATASAGDAASGAGVLGADGTLDETSPR